MTDADSHIDQVYIWALAVPSSLGILVMTWQIRGKKKLKTRIYDPYLEQTRHVMRETGSKMVQEIESRITEVKTIYNVIGHLISNMSTLTDLLEQANKRTTTTFAFWIHGANGCMPTLQDLWYYFRKDGTLRTELMKKIDARMDEIAYEKNHLDAEALAEDRLFGTWTRKWKERIKNLKELKQHPFFYIEGLETPSAEIRHQERLEVESDIQDINQHRFDMSNIEIFLERA